MAITQGSHHIGLTVPDIEATRNFFIDVLGFKLVGEIPDYPAFFVSDDTVMLTLWQATDPDKVKSFDRKNNIGLHHFALKVDSLATLKSIHRTLLDTSNVKIEFPPEPCDGLPAHHMMFYIPGGIRMELIAAEA